MISGLPASGIDEIWPSIEGYVEKAIHSSRFPDLYDAEFIKKGIRNRDFQLWIVYDDQIRAVVITQVLKYPKAKVLDLNFVGGENMLHLIEQGWGALKLFAKHEGCKYIRGYGRKGWTRLLPEKPAYSVVWDVEI